MGTQPEESQARSNVPFAFEDLLIFAWDCTWNVPTTFGDPWRRRWPVRLFVRFRARRKRRVPLGEVRLRCSNLLTIARFATLLQSGFP